MKGPRRGGAPSRGGGRGRWAGVCTRRRPAGHSLEMQMSSARVRPRLSGCPAAAIGLLVLCALSVSAASALAASPSFTALHASPSQMPPGHRTTISGSLGGGGRGRLIELQLLAGHGGFRNIAHTTTGPDGRYRFVPLRFEQTSVLRVIEVVPGGAVGHAIRLRVVVVLPPSARVRRSALRSRGREARSPVGSARSLLVPRRRPIRIALRQRWAWGRLAWSV